MLPSHRIERAARAVVRNASRVQPYESAHAGAKGLYTVEASDMEALRAAVLAVAPVDALHAAEREYLVDSGWRLVLRDGEERWAPPVGSGPEATLDTVWAFSDALATQRNRDQHAQRTART
jgi:hypothetical protein